MMTQKTEKNWWYCPRCGELVNTYNHVCVRDAGSGWWYCSSCGDYVNGIEPHICSKFREDKRKAKK